MERYPDVALAPHPSSPLSPLHLFFPHSPLHSLLISSLSPCQSSGHTALKKSKVQKNIYIRKIWKSIGYSLGNLLFSVFLFFPDLSLLILFSTVARGVCLSRRVCCVSPIEESCRLRAWACVCVCVRQGERERENVCVCLCVSHCSEWGNRGCFKKAALPMWPAQPQAGIHYWDTHTHIHTHTHSLSLPLSLSLALPPLFLLSCLYTHHVHSAPPSHRSG